MDSGLSMTDCAVNVRIQPEPFDAGAEAAQITRDRMDVGALVSFVGLCRAGADDPAHGALAALELEHYPGMAEAEITRVAEAAANRWPLIGITAIHRHGRIAPGEGIVLVIAAAAHRRAAFEAAEFLMDYLKTRAPFWKKEHFADGSAGGWVDAKDHDDAAAARWEI